MVGPLSEYRIGNDQFLDAESQRKETKMEIATQNEKEKKLEAGKTGKGKFLSAFVNFLAMGGFLIILIAIVAIIVLISYLTK